MVRKRNFEFLMKTKKNQNNAHVHVPSQSMHFFEIEVNSRQKNNQKYFVIFGNSFLEKIPPNDLAPNTASNGSMLVYLSPLHIF